MKNLHDKLASRGVASLSDEELLALMIESSSDSRDPKSLAANVLSACGSLHGVVNQELGRLRMIEGLGLRRAEHLVVAAELGRRVALCNNMTIDKISTDADVVNLMRAQMDSLSHEECWVLYLTSSNRIIERQRVSQGGVQATVVDYRLIVKRALELLATQLILVHNHPSGAAQPSEADKVLTKRVKEAAALFDIKVLDHVIISKEGDFSFRRASLL